MSRGKTVRLLYGREGMTLRVPASAAVLEGQDVRPVRQPDAAVRHALAEPIGSAPLADLVKARSPRTVAITISDITRPVPNRAFLPPLLEVLDGAGVDDSQVVIIIGTGMHRPSSPQERQALVGERILKRIEVIDHVAAEAGTLVKVSEDPRVSVNRRFAEADFHIVTGYIEPHFMAGFSGGRKGVGVDFLFNVAITRDRQIAGIYCGELEAAHLVGCEDVAGWTSAEIDGPFDLVITNGGGYPLDATFYQTVKGMCTALPALGPDSTMLIVSECSEQLGSKAFAELMLSYDNDWRRFLSDAAASAETKLDQWELQMQSRVLERIGLERLWLVSDGIPAEMQRHIAVTPVLGAGDAKGRAQGAIDEFLSTRPDARLAVIPDGPYTMLRPE
jgi:nickel-dependent lactate racemase